MSHKKNGIALWQQLTWLTLLSTILGVPFFSYSLYLQLVDTAAYLPFTQTLAPWIPVLVNHILMCVKAYLEFAQLANGQATTIVSTTPKFVVGLYCEAVILYEILGVLVLRGSGIPYNLAAFFVLSILFIINTTFLALLSYAWVRGKRGTWKLPLKRLGRSVDQNYRHSTTFYRPAEWRWLPQRRPADDEVSWSSVYFLGRIAQLLTQRVEGVESLHLAVSRNILSFFLIFGITARSIQLLHKVAKQEVAVEMYPRCFDSLPVNLSSSFIYFSPSQTGWEISAALLPSNSTSIASIPHSCTPSRCAPPKDFPEIDLTDARLQLQASRNQSASNALNDIPPLWLGNVRGLAFSFNAGAQLQPGVHLQGIVRFSQLRELYPTFPVLIGLSSAYRNVSILDVEWSTIPTLLQNNSVASATLQFERPAADYTVGPSGYDCVTPRHVVMREYHTFNFLDAITSIGGLLAFTQGIHILLFGRPLSGIFGAKLLNPFGLIGKMTSDSQSLIDRYGYLAGTDASKRGLGQFLSDFVLDIGPLVAKREDDERASSSSPT